MDDERRADDGRRGKEKGGEERIALPARRGGEAGPGHGRGAGEGWLRWRNERRRRGGAPSETERRHAKAKKLEWRKNPTMTCSVRKRKKVPNLDT